MRCVSSDDVDNNEISDLSVISRDGGKPWSRLTSAFGRAADDDVASSDSFTSFTS